MTPPPVVPLDTERLMLREFDDGDLAPLAVILSDPRVMEYSVAGPMSLDAVRDFLVSCRRCYEVHGFGQWAVVERASGRLLGFCGVSPVRLDGRDEVELAYRLAADRWGEGLASEAASAVLAAAFDRWQWSSVVAIIANAHAASRRVAEKLGMMRDRATQYRGWDVVVYRRYRDPDSLSGAIESR